jgi:predicted metal-binding membrane protein
LVGSTVNVDVRQRRRQPAVGVGVPLVMLSLAAVGWWWSARMAGALSAGSTGMTDIGMASDQVISLGAFLVAWLAMMTAMMFPAIIPVVKLYARAAAADRVAPLPFFVGGYLLVWTSLGLPVYLAWQALMEPMSAGRPWAGRLAGGVLVVAAAWQLTPLKSICLRHCRSPISLFVRYGSSIGRPVGALRMGAAHGLVCVGCCWALMAVLVAVGTMNLAWMLALAGLILVEKNAPGGERLAFAAAVVLVALGTLLLIYPATFTTLT